MKARPILFSAGEKRIRAAAGRLRISPDDYAAGLNRGEKLCGKCRTWLARTSENFGTDRQMFDGLRSNCRPCVSAVKKARYARVRPEERARQRVYQEANRPKLYAYNAKWQRTRAAALRAEMIAAYGGQCACCGEAEPIFLDLDHIYNDGAAHRRELGNGVQVQLSLKAAGWPRDRFQLLCCNCNQGKARNGGVCPHLHQETRRAG